MPTNKLWLEHTERAAWESVEALRQKLAAAEERVARVAPAGESWRTIIEALELASQRFGLEQQGYAEIAQALLERATTLSARVKELEAQLEGSRRAEVVATAAYSSRALDDERLPIDASDIDSSARRFARLLARRSKTSTFPRKSADALIRSIERVLDELEDVPLSEASDAAVELGVIALRLEQLSSSERHHEPLDDDDAPRARGEHLDDDLD